MRNASLYISSDNKCNNTFVLSHIYYGDAANILFFVCVFICGIVALSNTPNSMQ